MSESIAVIMLWLFVVNLGISFGAGLYESRIVVPQWITRAPGSEPRWNAEPARQADTGLKFWAYVTTVPLTLLTIVNLVMALRADGSARGWWLAACAAALVDRALTFSYFIPTMLRLMSDQVTPESKAAQTAVQWARLGYLRHAATLIAWLTSIQALTTLRR